MVLRITNDPPEQYALTDKVMTPKDFADPATHPYIASRKWNKVYVDIDDTQMPTGLIRQLVRVYVIVPVIRDVENISTRGMLLLGEIYPDYISKLRAFYMKDRAQFTQLVRQLVGGRDDG